MIFWSKIVILISKAAIFENFRWFWPTKTWSKTAPFRSKRCNGHQKFQNFWKIRDFHQLRHFCKIRSLMFNKRQIKFLNDQRMKFSKNNIKIRWSKMGYLWGLQRDLFPWLFIVAACIHCLSRIHYRIISLLCNAIFDCVSSNNQQQWIHWVSTLWWTNQVHAEFILPNEFNLDEILLTLNIFLDSFRRSVFNYCQNSSALNQAEFEKLI